MKLHEKLREYRNSSDLKLIEVSKETGLSISYISEIERGITIPSLKTCQKLAEYYKTNLSNMFINVRC